MAGTTDTGEMINHISESYKTMLIWMQLAIGAVISLAVYEVRRVGKKVEGLLKGVYGENGLLQRLTKLETEHKERHRRKDDLSEEDE